MVVLGKGGNFGGINGGVGASGGAGASGGTGSAGGLGASAGAGIISRNNRNSNSLINRFNYLFYIKKVFS